MRLHSDENIHCASQSSSLVSFLMLLNWFLPSSVVKKNPTSTCLVGQFRKMNPWLSWVLLLADHEHICIFIAPAEFSKFTNMKHFYHLSFSIWNDTLMSIQNTLVSTSPAKLQPPNTLGLLLPSLSPLQCISLVSALQRWTKLRLCWPAPHCASGRGKHHVTGSEWACFLFCPCSKSKKNRINKVFTKDNEVNSTILRMKLNRQYHPSTGDQSFLWISVEVSISSSSIISLSQNFAMLKILFKKLQ